jgi:hypothetical protein
MSWLWCIWTAALLLGGAWARLSRPRCGLLLSYGSQLGRQGECIGRRPVLSMRTCDVVAKHCSYLLVRFRVLAMRSGSSQDAACSQPACAAPPQRNSDACLPGWLRRFPFNRPIILITGEFTRIRMRMRIRIRTGRHTRLHCLPARLLAALAPR